MDPSGTLGAPSGSLQGPFMGSNGSALQPWGLAIHCVRGEWGISSENYYHFFGQKLTRGYYNRGGYYPTAVTITGNTVTYF